MKKIAIDDDDEESAPAAKPYRGMFVVFGGLVALALLIGLYQAKTEAQATRKHIAQLEQELKETRRAISARDAEIAYLERPERLREIAKSRLNLSPVQTGQLRSLDDLRESAEQTPSSANAAPNPGSGALSVEN